jgi:hypothetical protein
MCTTAPTTKICSVCRLPQPTDQFTKHGGHRDGLGSNCHTCRNELARAWRQRRRLAQTNPDAPQSFKAIKSPPKPKPLPTVDPELVIDIPGVWEVQNRGRGTRSFNFTSLVDNSTFSFPTFREARQARAEMMDAFRQQAVFESVHRRLLAREHSVKFHSGLPHSPLRFVEQSSVLKNPGSLQREKCLPPARF